jgi:hypothetical protein
LIEGETVPNDYFVAWTSAAVNVGCVLQPKAPSNYKDPKAIADYVAKEMEKQKERSEHLPGVAMLTRVLIVDGDNKVVLNLENKRNAWSEVARPFFRWLCDFSTTAGGGNNSLIGKYIRTLLRITAYELMSVAVSNKKMPLLWLLRTEDGHTDGEVSPLDEKCPWQFVDPIQAPLPVSISLLPA